MLYYLFNYLHDTYHWPGTGLFKYISFRAALSVLLSFAITFLVGQFLINFLKRKQIIETNRMLGLQEDQLGTKARTPTMGGLLIILATILPTLLLSKWDNIYCILLVVTTIWMGSIGFLDDYVKVFKKQKAGLNGWIKLIGQFVLGFIVGGTLYFHESVVIREYPLKSSPAVVLLDEETGQYRDTKSTKTTVPFFKDNSLDYAQIAKFLFGNETYTWLLYISVIAFIIASVSNGANLTDGLDGLTASTAVVVGTTLAILAYLSGHILFSKYLNIMYIPNLGELAVFCCAFVGACTGFLWYNAYPAQIFMGDTGSLSIGSVIAVVAICIRKELLLPVLCGIFLIETGSVILQTSYFKYTRKKYGTGQRIFKMAPLHHHYQKLGWHEAKIVVRFLIISLLLAVLTLVTLKIR
jgi:phospho-N-acetylmuramoyl-pentapeptide-transferase